eukprot:CAMPEP_0196804336 /NCGR_PEP_ID=MMETSP1362-20130617/3935_1 /TAXON_ID=163516 /ORGANISM="Leptocylindrus danicus, Strain CCMP1856" /LENGTH=367 /DNA_ID=CAMNT_0042176571 /DNA_START=471 /DNA_END=1572 /DNA_ORIENTATION=+
MGQIGSVNEIIDRRSPDLGDVACSESFADNPVAYFGALAAITSSTQSVFMVASTLGKIQFVHNIQISRSRDGTSSFLGLSGFGSIASPIIIPREAFLRSTPVPCPPTSRILKRLSFSTDGVSDADFVRYSFRPMVPIPYFLSSFLIGTNLVDMNSEVPAVDVLRALKAACNSLDAAVDVHHATKLDWHAGSEFLVPFLFIPDSAFPDSFGVDLCRSVELSTSLATYLSVKVSFILGGSSDAVAARTVAAASTAAAAPAAADTTTPTSDHHDTTTLHRDATNTSTNNDPAATAAKQIVQDDVVEQLKKNFVQTLSLQRTLTEAFTKDKAETNEAKKTWNKIPAGRRQMALAAASTDGEHPAVDLPESG